jgi:flavin-binding protein dodecin
MRKPTLERNVSPTATISIGQRPAPLQEFSGRTLNPGVCMSVARITEISATSSKSFEDAVQQGIQRATATLRNVRGAWIKEQEVKVENNRITEYRVIMKITFVLEDATSA